jgi:hypothetical protein
MTTRINEQQFTNMFADGIDPSKLPDGASTIWADKYDANKDGMVKGGELKPLYADLDALDGTSGGIVLGDDNTWDDRVFGGLTAMAKAPGQVRTLTVAREFIQDPVKQDQFGHDGACSPENPDVKSTYPDRWKCNAFVGEVMFKAGYEMPIYDDNGKYYHPNHLHKATKHFDNVTLADAQPGDLIVRDYNNGTGHVEIITDVQSSNGGTDFTSMGAHFGGIEETDEMSGDMKGAKRVGDHYELNGEKFWILRPKKPVTVQSPGINQPAPVRP